MCNLFTAEQFDFEAAKKELGIEIAIDIDSPDIQWDKVTRGRPSAKISVKKAEFLMAAGLRQSEVVKALNVADKTFMKWAKKRYGLDDFRSIKAFVIEKYKKEIALDDFRNQGTHPYISDTLK